jgi:hypothetical protein
MSGAGEHENESCGLTDQDAEMHMTGDFTRSGTRTELLK